MKKNILILVILSLLYSPGLAKVIIQIDGNYKSPELLVDAQHFYIFDYATFKMDVYSLKDSKKTTTFGRMGEGPGEFKMNPTLQICKDHIFASSTGKVMYFKKNGEFIKETKIPPTLLAILPVGKNIAGMSFSMSETPAKPGIKENEYCLVTPGEENIVPIYAFKGRVYVSRVNAPKQDRQIIRDVVIHKSDGNNLIIGDTNKGFYFCFINSKGKIFKELNIPYEKRRVTASDRKELMDDYKKKNEKRWDKMKETFNFVFPEYFPPYRSFKVDGERMYVLTHLIENKKQECLVIDYDGNIINRTMVPHHFNNIFYKGKMYYLVDNEKTEMWELHVEVIE